MIAARTGATVGRAQLAQLAGDLAGWVDEFYDQRAFGADTDLPDSDVIMMQADGKGIAVRPGHRATPARTSIALIRGSEDGRHRRRRRLTPPSANQKTSPPRWPAAGNAPARKPAING